MDKTLEAIAIALWRGDAERSAPNVVAYRTPETFADQSEQTRQHWLGFAQIAHAAFLANTDGGEIVERLREWVRYWKAQDEGYYDGGWGEDAEAAADHITNLTAQGAADRERITELEAALRKLIDVADMTANDENTGAMDRTIEAARAALSGAQSGKEG